MKKALLTALTLILALSLLAGCGGSGGAGNTAAAGTPETGTPSTAAPATLAPPEVSDETGIESLVVAITKDENTLTPYTYLTGTPGMDVMRLLYDTLFSFDEDNKVIPWMVEDGYTVDEDSKVYTVKLLPGQKWHDGTELTAEDVKFTFEYALEQTRTRWKGIASQVESIELSADGTMVFTLAEGNPNFLRAGLCDIPIIPKHIYEAVADAETYDKTVGSSMYRLAEYKIGEYYILEAMEGYFRGEAAVKTINMPIMTDSSAVSQALISGQIAASTGSVSPETVETFNNAAGIEIMSGRGYAPTMLQFNCEREILSDPAFRRALCLAIDTQSLINTVMLGYAMPALPGFYTEDMDGAVTENTNVYDVEAANKALDELGYADLNGDGIRLSGGEPIAFELLVYSGNTTRIRAAELIARDLQKVGIKVTVTPMEADTVDEYVWPGFDVAGGRDFDMAMWGWSAPVQLDPASLVRLAMGDTAKGNLNIGGLRDAGYDALCGQYLGTSNIAEREEIARELQIMLYELAPFMNLWYANMNYAVNTDMYDGWRIQTGTGIINRYSFLR